MKEYKELMQAKHDIAFEKNQLQYDRNIVQLKMQLLLLKS